MLLKELKEMVFTGHKIRAVERMVNKLPSKGPKTSVTGSTEPCDFPLIAHFNGTLLGSNLDQLPTWTKLSPPGYRHLTPTSIPGFQVRPVFLKKSMHTHTIATYLQQEIIWQSPRNSVECDFYKLNYIYRELETPSLSTTITVTLSISLTHKKNTGSIYDCTVNDVITSYMHLHKVTKTKNNVIYAYNNDIITST